MGGEYAAHYKHLDLLLNRIFRSGMIPKFLNFCLTSERLCTFFLTLGKYCCLFNAQAID